MLSGVVPSNFSSVNHFLKCLLYPCFSFSDFRSVATSLSLLSLSSHSDALSGSALCFLFFFGSSRSPSLLSSVANSSLRLFFSLRLSRRFLSFVLFLRSLQSSPLSLSDLFFLLFPGVFLRILAPFKVGSSSSLVSSVDDKSHGLRVLFLLLLFVTFRLGFSSSSSASFLSFFTLAVFSVIIFYFFTFASSGWPVSTLALLPVLTICACVSKPFNCAS